MGAGGWPVLRDCEGMLDFASSRPVLCRKFHYKLKQLCDWITGIDIDGEMSESR